MRILLTGGAGFLGSRLAPVLVERGHVVDAIDHTEGDLTDAFVADRLIANFHSDVTVHLAAQPGRVFGENDHAHTVMTNTVATINVARSCASIGARLCYVSTSEVYGTVLDAPEPIKEWARPGRPRNLYAASKLWGEQAAELYAPHGLKIIRPTMPYGPGMATGVGRAALPSMISSFLRGEPFTIHAGTARSWCYVDDLIRGMADVVETCDRSVMAEGVFNVGRDDDLRSMAEVALIVCETLGVSPDLIELGEPDDTISRTKNISTERLRGLGWRPTVDLPEGIELTVDSMRS